mmetsp:Transcript_6525/g.13127  ORF Transcript_6525/g.13127 Transcript_6525/m.13127 type:complete len:103 (-) Transcript_6525:1876-2184(-)
MMQQPAFLTFRFVCSAGSRKSTVRACSQRCGCEVVGDSELPAKLQRREILKLAVAAAVVIGIRPEATRADEKPGLPPGAAQFQRILAAKRRWEEVAVPFRTR